MKMDELQIFTQQNEKMSTLKRTVFLCLLICFLTKGLTEEIQAKSGDDVILHCHDPSNGNILVLRWIRPDLKAKGYVYFFRESCSYEQYQYPYFHGRVKLRDPQMKDGDFSVILNHFSLNDTGTYECFVGRNNSGSHPEIINVIHLKVKANQEDITAKSGDNVTLPCQAILGFTKFRWKKPDLNSEYFVYFFNNMKLHKQYQHESFQDRVELKDPNMKNGDASVILKNITINDTGTYECYVGQGSSSELINTIGLTVNQPGADERGGDKDGHVGLIVGLSVFILVVVVVSFIIYRKYIRPREQNNQPPADEETRIDMLD